jgi:protein-arginine kinase activator protein McsA
MICAQCGGEAAHTVAHRGIKEPMCPDCLRLLIPQFDAARFIDALLDTHSTPNQCPCCGTTFDQTQTTGLLGCPICYIVFQPQHC